MGCDPAVKEYLNIDFRCLQQSVQSSRVGKPFQKAVVSFKLNKIEVYVMYFDSVNAAAHRHPSRTF